jgi:1-deoxy-D-xylulose-5-phosphate reductoisomerase
MVAAGEILTRAARERNVPILPIDSEHNAVHQCLRVGAHAEVKTIWLTASGGPFRQLPLDQFDSITPAQALKHPTWVMGRRITIDSATMLNKGLEIIEACRLFDVLPSQVRVTVHPQSTVHSLVEYVDGSILAQISVTDMRLPILYALAYPERPASTLTFDLAALRHLEFEPPDFERFPCLRLAYEPPKRAEPTASPSTPPTRSPSRHSSKAVSPLWASRVQLKKCSHPRRRRIPPPLRRCWPPTGRRVKQLVSC